jgi:hypothetical protein
VLQVALAGSFVACWYHFMLLHDRSSDLAYTHSCFDMRTTTLHMSRLQFKRAQIDLLYSIVVKCINSVVMAAKVSPWRSTSPEILLGYFNEVIL